MSERTARIRTALATVVVAVVVLGGCDWAQIGFGPEAANFNPYEPALTPASASRLAEQWSSPCACDGNHPLVAGDTVYALDAPTGASPIAVTLRASAVADGSPRWSTPLGQTIDRGVLAAVANGLVYLVVRPASGNDQLVAADATSGRVRWRRTPPTSGTGRVRLDQPVVDGANVFVTATASDATTLSAFDPTGHRAWTVVPGGQVLAGSYPAAAGQTVYVSSFIGISNGDVVVLLRGYAESDGTVVSSVTIPNAALVQSLAVANDLVYGTFYTAFGRLSNVGTFAIDPNAGAIKWTGELFTLAVTPGAVLSNNPRSGVLVAHDPITGAPKWTANQTDFAAAASDQLVFFSGGDIRQLSDGALVGHVQTTAGAALTQATPSGGRVFATSPSSLYALAP